MKNKRIKRVIGNSIWKFTDENPGLSRLMSKAYHFLDKLMILYFVFVACLIILPVVIVYSILPEQIRDASAAIIGSILSLIVIPLIMNTINRKKENERKRFETNKGLYEELSQLLIYVIASDSSRKDDSRCRAFEDFIVKHYYYMCVNCSIALMCSIYRTYREYVNNHMENAQYYAERCITYIRREGGSDASFLYTESILELIKNKLADTK